MCTRGFVSWLHCLFDGEAAEEPMQEHSEMVCWAIGTKDGSVSEITPKPPQESPPAAVEPKNQPPLSRRTSWWTTDTTKSFSTISTSSTGSIKITIKSIRITKQKKPSEKVGRSLKVEFLEKVLESNGEVINLLSSIGSASVPMNSDRSETTLGDRSEITIGDQRSETTLRDREVSHDRDTVHSSVVKNEESQSLIKREEREKKKRSSEDLEWSVC